ncbi:MAG: carboxypeptidase-like regulatory domain-containing protein [Planctomycetes bacterium]|nr:carboxypeptidase-like regulatory domain-containing protein [Planctomycetota bacterium]
MKKRDFAVFTLMGVVLVVSLLLVWIWLPEGRIEGDPVSGMEGNAFGSGTRIPAPTNVESMVISSDSEIPAGSARLALEPAKAFESNRVFFQGVVLDAESHRAVPGGSINAWSAGARRSGMPFYAQTDGEGRFDMIVSGPGPWDLEVHAPGYRSQDLWIEESPDDVQVLLARNPDTVHGTIRDSTGPVQGALVEFRTPELFLETTSGINGGYSLEGLPALRRYTSGWLSAYKEGHGSARVQINETRGSNKLDLLLKKDRELWITCLYADTREPLQGASVALCSSRKSDLFEIELGPKACAGFDGTARLKGIPRTACQLMIESTHAVPQILSIGPATGDGPEKALALLRTGGRVTGRVIGEGEKQIIAKFSFIDQGRPSSNWKDVPRCRFKQTFQMQEPGIFEYDGLVPEIRYQCLIEAEGYALCSLAEEFQIECGKTADLGTIRMERGRTVLGKVVSPDGDPVAGARLRVRDAKWRFEWRVPPTDRNGVFQVDHAPNIPFWIDVFSSNGAFAADLLEVEDTEVKIVLGAPEEWTLTARVRDVDGVPLDHLPILVTEANLETHEHRVREAQTDSSGRLEVNGLLIKIVDLNLPSGWPGRFTEGVQRFSRGDKEREIVVVHDRFLSGWIVSLPAKEPLHPAEAAWLEEAKLQGERGLVFKGTTDTRGAFRVRATQGEGLLRLNAPGCLERMIPIESGMVDLDLGLLALEPAPRLFVRVWSPGGEPVPDAAIVVEPMESQGNPVRGATDACGQAVLTLIEGGLRRVTASLGEQSLSKEIDCSGSGPWIVNLAGLDAEGAKAIPVRIRVLDPGGSPLVHCKNVILADQKQLLFCDSDSQGYVEFSNVLPGRYDLRAYLEERNLTVGANLVVPSGRSFFETEVCFVE